jgi:hypothetical protein
VWHRSARLAAPNDINEQQVAHMASASCASGRVEHGCRCKNAMQKLLTAGTALMKDGLDAGMLLHALAVAAVTWLADLLPLCHRGT